MSPWRVVVSSALLVASVTVGAGEATGLRAIMVDLGQATARLTQALMADDLDAAAQAAQAIADHPRPPMAERWRLLGRLGADAAGFRRADAKVHETAMAVARAARDGDAARATRGFHELVDACLACHRAYRERLRAPGGRADGP